MRGWSGRTSGTSCTINLDYGRHTVGGQAPTLQIPASGSTQGEDRTRGQGLYLYVPLGHAQIRCGGQCQCVTTVSLYPPRPHAGPAISTVIRIGLGDQNGVNGGDVILRQKLQKR